MGSTASTSLVHLTPQVLAEIAISQGVCVRPVMQRRTDTLTGDTVMVPIRCNATEDRKCPSCAQRNRWLRITQCHEGWHLDEEPEDPDPGSDPGADDEQTDAGDRADPEADQGRTRRVRSTRRRQDVPDLPRLPVDKRTVGKAFTAKDGTTYRPSMFLTLTLGSYGRVHPDGTPVDPATYDYRAAALDALHFARLFDRFIQNLRRAVGYQVQYFAVVEPQQRLAPHLHAALRGAIPHKLLRQVVTATYQQLWWPPHDEPVYVDLLPVWDHQAEAYVDPDTGMVLPTFEQALADLDDDPDARPAHVLRFGTRMASQGLIATQADAGRRVRYLTKYLTKSIAEGIGDPDDMTPRQLAHLNRLHEEVRWLPCTERCWNWLRFGVQPENAQPGMEPGRCPNKAHDRDHLGVGGRRTLVSRKWTRKTLADHRADRAAVVAEVLDSAGIDMPDQDACSATTTRPDGKPRYRWDPVLPGDPDAPTYRQAITALIAERQRWRQEYEAAKAQVEQATVGHSATGPPFGNGSGGGAAA
jgi:hypothetical protein